VDPLDPAWGPLRGAPRVRPDGLVEARARPQTDPDPAPLAPGEGRALLDALDGGRPYREAFECLLAQVARQRRGHLLQVSKESRGAWALLLSARRGSALHVGSALSGAVVPLTALGLRVTLLDASPERLQVGRAVAEAQVAGRVRGVLGGDGGALPFEDASFDVVACDVERLDDTLLAELARVTRSELVLLVDNRLGYKRSSGRTWDFHVPGPLAYARSVLRPARGERTLSGWRRAVARALARAEAYALYPDRRDFAAIAALDAERPRLFVGPNEARNRLKVAAHRAGLFPVLTPSFALLARRGETETASPRLLSVLQAVAEATGEPLPEAEHVVGTRGNTCVVMTAVPGGDPADPRGRWLLHLPLHLPHRRGLEVHFHALERMRADFPGLPAPAPLWMGEADGLWLTCERRLPGWASNHLLTSREAADAILEQMVDHLARLVVRPTRPLNEADFERVVSPLYDDTLRAVRDAALRAELERRRLDARRLLVGRELPLVYAHGDVRAKHVQVDEDGHVLGFLDFGTVVDEALPGLDVMHRIVHDRKQLEGMSDGETWRELCDPQRLRVGERRALDRYARAVGLDPRLLPIVARVYPVFVGAVVERYAPFVRPDWFRHTFGI
jgi:hypothetical protein